MNVFPANRIVVAFPLRRGSAGLSEEFVTPAGVVLRRPKHWS